MADTKCSACGTEIRLGVYQSAAGFYIGTFCPNCGPYSRDSGYYATEAEAEAALKAMTIY
jgi:hypothetical protein